MNAESLAALTTAAVLLWRELVKAHDQHLRRRGDRLTRDDDDEDDAPD